MTDEMTIRHGFVAILDALGMKTSTIEDSKNFIRVRSNLVKSLEESSDILKSRFGEEMRALRMPRYLGYSDMLIIIWETSEYEITSIIPYLSELISSVFVVGLTNNVLWRGAVSYGQFLLYKGSLLGPAVSDAASWYEECNWIGIVTTPKLGFHVSMVEEEMKTGGKKPKTVREELRCVFYNVPLKDGSSSMLWVPDWPTAWNHRCVGKEIDCKKELFEVFGTFTTSKREYSKYLNTLKFYDYAMQG
ncbi:MAG: hypothetical protein C4542_08865 [Dehalococcoidia bacterium]|nr:MAG: hypothetical protein C4542_08865 [Dehalococcoidia bacterium]